MTKHRRIGQTAIDVSAVGMGCWPIAGMASTGVNDADSIATLQAAVDAGINFFDTAHNYGLNGESERLIASALGHRRDEIVIATKGGLSWGEGRTKIKNARPEQLRLQCEESLTRLQTDHVDLLYLHAPDPALPIAESAGGLAELLREGKTRAVGVSNVSLEQLKEFAAACPLSAYQPAYNMLQREIETSQLPWCIDNQVSAIIYWPLVKGLLAGKLPRDHVLDEKDSRRKYPMFQGEEWQKNQDLVDRLRAIAELAGKTVSQLVVNWTFSQPGITCALCGAKRPEQIRETAGAMGWELSETQRQQIDQTLRERGQAASRSAV